MVVEIHAPNWWELEISVLEMLIKTIGAPRGRGVEKNRPMGI